MKSTYKIISNYQDNEVYRNEFFKFISKVFPGVCFKEWYEKGFWTDNYITYSAIHSGRIISNAGAAYLDIIISGELYKAVQLGAVGTLPEYRNKGLSRKLMELVLEQYHSKVDLFFLYANESVMEFYSKFGFKKIDESSFIAELVNIKSDFSAKQLNLNSEDDYNLIIDLIKYRQPITKLLGAINYDFITMWHLLNHYRDNIFYLEKEDAIVLKEERGDTIHLLEIINKSPIEIETLLPRIISTDKINKVKYYFPPDQLKYEYDRVTKEESGLFVLSKKEFNPGKFRFPITATT